MFLTSPNKMFKYLLTAFILLLFVSEAQPQVAKTSYKILGISVEGSKSADAATIIANSGLRVGDEIQVPGDQTLNAIRRLWALNIFSDIKIEIEKQIADGVFLVLKVEEYPRVEKVVYEGNDEVSEKDIEEKISFTRGQILKPQEVNRLKLRIQKLYEAEGYLNTQIDINNYTFFRADTTDDGITVIWQNRKDLSDEYELEYPSSEQRYTNLIDRIKDRILLKVKIYILIKMKV